MLLVVLSLVALMLSICSLALLPAVFGLIAAALIGASTCYEFRAAGWISAGIVSLGAFGTAIYVIITVAMSSSCEKDDGDEKEGFEKVFCNVKGVFLTVMGICACLWLVVTTMIARKVAKKDYTAN